MDPTNPLVAATMTDAANQLLMQQQQLQLQPIPPPPAQPAGWMGVPFPNLGAGAGLPFGAGDGAARPPAPPPAGGFPTFDRTRMGLPGFALTGPMANRGMLVRPPTMFPPANNTGQNNIFSLGMQMQEQMHRQGAMMQARIDALAADIVTMRDALDEEMEDGFPSRLQNDLLVYTCTML